MSSHMDVAQLRVFKTGPPRSVQKALTVFNASWGLYFLVVSSSALYSILVSTGKVLRTVVLGLEIFVEFIIWFVLCDTLVQRVVSLC